MHPIDNEPGGSHQLESPAAEFERRLDELENVIVRYLHTLYGNRTDFQTQLERIISTAAEYHTARSERLRIRDRDRSKRWFQEPAVVGAWLYIERFAGTLLALEEHLDELTAAGVGYLHLMPPFARPPENNDGGYAVNDYRKIDEELGTMAELEHLASAMHERDMTLALDFVFNHTADDHPWAQAAKAGSAEDLDVYLTFATEDETREYAEHLRSIFPDEKPGSFIYDESLQRWVWATFHSFQWDLDYRNPETFRRMLAELLFLANRGVDVLRLDAVPFIWKEPGTPCENLPQSHLIIRALNALVRIAAPSMIFKSEAIVHPRDVVAYFGSSTPLGREAELAYNPVLMVGLWEALATEHTALLRRSMQSWFTHPSTTAWVNYVRSHDDIGWGFADEDAAALGIDPMAHRNYLTEFYTGSTTNSFANGAPFQANPSTGDVRISGTTASLAGLETALAGEDAEEIELAVRRIVMIHGIVLATPGVPLLNVVDLIGMTNDHDYLADAATAEDSRWLHRPRYDWDAHAARHDHSTVAGRIHETISAMTHIRRRITAFGGAGTLTTWDIGNDHLYVASVDGNSVLVVANFSRVNQPFTLPPGRWEDALADLEPPVDVAGPETDVPPYGLLWLLPDAAAT